MDSDLKNSNVKQDDLKQLAEYLAQGKLTVADFLEQVGQHNNLSSQHVTLDLDRQRRCGFPEVIYAEGKPAETVVAIARELDEHGLPVLATRVDPSTQALLREHFADAVINETARTFRMGEPVSTTLTEQVAVITAGTSDQPVAEEAAETLAWMGLTPLRIADVGVAGPHRLQEQAPRLQGLAAVVVVAGMEGALPSVVGGWVDCPVFAVPTSVGYGASFSGLAALLGMLNSCASNVAVVNIDSGFKAGYLAGMVAQNQANATMNARENAE